MFQERNVYLKHLVVFKGGQLKFDSGVKRPITLKLNSNG